MPHPRKQIRDAVVDRLKDRTPVGSRVFGNRVRPLFGEELPAILVYTLAEKSDHRQTAPRELQRILRLGIEIAARADEGLDDLLDEISLRVEEIMSADDTLSGTAADCSLESTEMAVFRDGDRLVGACRLDYAVVYYTREPADETLQDHYTFQPGELEPGEFRIGGVQWDLADEPDENGRMSPDGIIEAEDRFEEES